MGDNGRTTGLSTPTSEATLSGHELRRIRVALRAKQLAWILMGLTTMRLVSKMYVFHLKHDTYLLKHDETACWFD